METRVISYFRQYPLHLKWFPTVAYAFVFSLSAYLTAFRNADIQTDLWEERHNFEVIDKFDFIVGKS